MMRFMGSGLFLFELLSEHEPENRKCLEIKGAIFRFMESTLGLPVMPRAHEPENVQRSTLNAQGSTLNAQRSTPNAQRSTPNGQRVDGVSRHRNACLCGSAKHDQLAPMGHSPLGPRPLQQCSTVDVQAV
jgi:hypothetical protein